MFTFFYDLRVHFHSGQTITISCSFKKRDWLKFRVDIIKLIQALPDLFCKAILDHLDTLFHSQMTFKKFASLHNILGTR